MTTDQIHDLSAWDNVAPRTYTGRVICFPFDDDARKNQAKSAQTLMGFLRNSLDCLDKERPDFAGKLQLGTNLTATQKKQVVTYKPGNVYLLTSPTFHIHLRPKYPNQLASLYGNITAINNGHSTVTAQPINFDSRFLNYDTLKQAKFPVKPFINPDLCTDLVLGNGNPPIPVVELEVIFLNGGFFFNLLIHHTYFDGKAYHKFLECFAAVTRGDNTKIPVYPSNPMFRLSYETAATVDQGQSLVKAKAEDLLSGCKEYGTWPGKELNGPTQPILESIPGVDNDKMENDSKIFIFSFAKLKGLAVELAQLLPEGSAKPSAYTVLSALLWAHSFVARERYYSSPTLSSSSESSESSERSSRAARAAHQTEVALHKHFQSHTPHFSTPVDFSSPKIMAQFPPSCSVMEQSNNYFGNSITWSLTPLPSPFLLQTIAQSRGNKSKSSLAHLASAISGSIGEIGPEFLYKREALLDKLEDVRVLGLNWEGRQASEWGMNTWAGFGAGVVWGLPGVAESGDGDTATPDSDSAGGSGSGMNGENLKKGTLADAQRRVQKEIGISGGLILPGRQKREKEWEVQISLPKGAMRALERDGGFMGWCEGVVGDEGVEYNTQ
ncbi:hypothetical protein B0T20DRAFT_469762 [Sordaria brevicollis]|uniref:Uncharacterized protein n=1 Tax=Sordaria brevicollis TaxID=83679 RepID=A0AAE0UCB8_SORBR|nr:hypothetical protein B0T20DRAFT_469762 [Sordaria brevicollis]